MNHFFFLKNRLSLQKAAIRFFTLVVAGLVMSLPARAQVVFDNFTDTGEPPFKLGPYSMTKVVDNTNQNGSLTNSVPLRDGKSLTLNNSQGNGNNPMTVVTVGDLFPWGHGYSGKAYGDLQGTSTTLFMPDGVNAFYFYAKPLVGTYTITVKAHSARRGPPGSGVYYDQAEVVATKEVSYLEAKFFGFHVPNPDHDIDFISMEISAGGVLYIGEFGYSTCGLNFSAFTASNQLTCTNPNSSTLTYAVPAGSNQTNFIFIGPNGLFEQTTQNKITVSRPGEYSVYPFNPATANETETCPLSLTLVEDKRPPDVTLINDGPLSCSKVVVTLRAVGGSAGDTYTFSGPEDDIIQSGYSTTAPAGSVGTYSLTATGTNGCSGTVVQTTVTRNPVPPTPTITNLDAAYCQNAQAVTLVGNPAGGSFTIDGQPATQLDPARLSFGSHTVRYSLTQNGCTSFTEQTVEIKAVPDAGFSGLAGSYCANAAQITLSPVTAGGNFTGLGVTGNTFTPATAGSGGFVTYSLTVNGCTNSSRQSVTVNPLPLAFALAGGGSYCVGSAAPAVGLSGSQTGVSYQLRRNEADVSGALVSGTGSAISFGPHTEAGTYTVLASSANSCQQVQTGSVSVIRNVKPEASLKNDGSITCLKTASVLTASGGTAGDTYRFSGPNQFVQNGSGSQATVSAGGLYSLTVTNTTGCSATASNTVEENITPPQQVRLSNGGTLSCTKTSTSLIPGSDTPGVTFVLSGPALTGSNATGPGQYTVTATNPTNGCTATATTDVNQNIALPTGVKLTSSGTLSANNPTVTLTATSNATANVSVSYSVSPPAQKINDTQASVTTSGTYSVTATRADNGCAASATTTVLGAASATACRGTSATISLTPAGSPSRYEWYIGVAVGQPLRDGAYYQGTTTASLRVVTVSQSQIYYAKVYYADGSSVVYGPYRVTMLTNCGAREAAAVEPGEFTRANELRITLLGNPLQGEALRAVVTGAAGQRLSVQLLDVKGQSVRSQTFESAESGQLVEWPLNGSGSGLYLLQAISGQQRHNVKVVKP